MRKSEFDSGQIQSIIGKSFAPLNPEDIEMRDTVKPRGAKESEAPKCLISRTQQNAPPISSDLMPVLSLLPPVSRTELLPAFFESKNVGLRTQQNSSPISSTGYDFLRVFLGSHVLSLLVVPMFGVTGSADVWCCW